MSPVPSAPVATPPASPVLPAAAAAAATVPAQPRDLPGVHRVVVIGGGFGGLAAAQALRRAPPEVAVTLIDRRNFNLFQPLLYQVATGLLSPANIASPLRSLLRDQANARVILAEATGFDLGGRRVLLDQGFLRYDTLIVAAGSCPNYFGNPGWEELAPPLKTVEDAERVRSRIFGALERAEAEDDRQAREALLTFIITGGGPTSVELAGAVAEITRRSLRREFRRIDPAAARILLVEAEERVLAAFSEASSAEAARALAKLGVEVLLRTRVVAIDPGGVNVRDAGGVRRIPAATVLWGAGVQAVPLGQILARAAAAQPGHGGRVVVNGDCTLPGHPDVFVIGDLAAFGEGRTALPGVAQVAMQQGGHAARAILDRLAGRRVQPFAYRELGSMAVIGRRLAVAEIGTWKLRGRIAWLAWLALHLVKLVRLENRILVLVQWAWSYVTWNRSARLITAPRCPPPP